MPTKLFRSPEEWGVKEVTFFFLIVIIVSILIDNI